MINYVISPWLSTTCIKIHVKTKRRFWWTPNGTSIITKISYLILKDDMSWQTESTELPSNIQKISRLCVLYESNIHIALVKNIVVTVMEERCMPLYSHAVHYCCACDTVIVSVVQRSRVLLYRDQWAIDLMRQALQTTITICNFRPCFVQGR